MSQCVVGWSLYSQSENVKDFQTSFGFWNFGFNQKRIKCDRKRELMPSEETVEKGKKAFFSIEINTQWHATLARMLLLFNPYPLAVYWFWKKWFVKSTLQTCSKLETGSLVALDPVVVSNSSAWALFHFPQFCWWSCHVWHVFSLLGQPSATHFPISFWGWILPL